MVCNPAHVRYRYLMRASRRHSVTARSGVRRFLQTPQITMLSPPLRSVGTILWCVFSFRISILAGRRTSLTAISRLIYSIRVFCNPGAFVGGSVCVHVWRQSCDVVDQGERLAKVCSVQGTYGDYRWAQVITQKMLICHWHNKSDAGAMAMMLCF